ncbi:MAG: TonB-dependent receptor [Methylobacter sp.]|uniref:TonB C-terminal domain-containing protein n=1 Tax=Methylovulum miyakonense TaxID=645578 RepID=UPI00036C6DD8|nr:TonB C-terminal domain-containing protein [Methylovulum miyakonense]PPD48818.1 MAG: TonB-dependent receptor [Methylobacter sp.]
MTTKKKHFRVYLPTIIGGLILLVVTGLIIRAISNIQEKPEKKERTIQKITLTKPPPPPPPPPKVEKPPEPEIEEKIEQAPEPEPEEMPDVADEPPPGDLGLDAEGSAGSDGFGLAARKGGKGLLGGGGGGDPYAWYGGLIKNDILDILSEHEELRKKGFTAIIKLWLNVDGSVQRFELARGSNDAEIDDLINRLLSKYRKVDEPLPPGMEQPVKLRITSRI